VQNSTNEIPLASFRDFRHLDLRKGKLQFNDLKVVGSGKSAMSLILQFLRMNGALSNKNSVVLCPPWMGSWVYSTITQFALPSLNVNSEISAVHVYHQWGYSQKMDLVKNYCSDKKIPYYEDCAHSLQFVNQTLTVGNPGSKFAFSSPSKFLPIAPIGLLKTSDSNFQEFIEYQQMMTSKMRMRLNAIQKIRIDTIIRNNPGQNSSKAVISAGRLYAPYPHTHRSTSGSVNRLGKLTNENTIRTNRERIIYETLSPDVLLQDNYAESHSSKFKIPILLPQKKIAGLIDQYPSWSKLVAHFDINRNIFNPDYRKVVGLAVSSSIPDKVFFQQIEILQSLK